MDCHLYKEKECLVYGVKGGQGERTQRPPLPFLKLGSSMGARGPHKLQGVRGQVIDETHAEAYVIHVQFRQLNEHPTQQSYTLFSTCSGSVFNS